MIKLDKLFKTAKKLYDHNINPLSELLDITNHCLNKISSEATLRYQSKLGDKKYYVFETENGISRPFLKTLYIKSQKNFTKNWNNLVSKINPEMHKIDLTSNEVNKVLYTSAMAFAICYDIWKNSSRKTPGTYFEILIGSILGNILNDYKRTKYIPLPIHQVIEEEKEESVSTDIVFEKTDEKGESVSTDIVFEKTKDNGEIIGLVIPVKTTTRERIVQPFAHQRILDSFFGKGRFKSTLICISEMQLDKKNNNVHEICVPGTIRLFQAHLAELTGIFYLDPPSRYLKEDLTKFVTIGSLGELLTQSYFKD